MANSRFFDDLSFSPFKKDLESYSRATLRQDLLAGASVALLTVPQAMAYALLAGLPLYCGLFASVFSAIIAAIFGSSRHLVIGPSNAIAILVQGGTSQILFTYYRDLSGPDRELAAIAILTQLSLLIGILQILAAGFKLGRLTQFISHSVIIGYITGAALAVIVNQLFIFLGIPDMAGLHSLYEKGAYLVTHVHQSHWPTAAVGLGSLILLLFLKRLNRYLPAAAITLALAAVAVFLFDLSSYSNDSGFIDPYSDETLRKVMLVGDTGEVYEVIPSFEFSAFNTGIMNSLLPVAFALALLSIMETASVAKALAANSGQRLSINQEIFGLGLGNLMSSFITAMPVSGSPSRSAANYAYGAQTRFSAIFNAITVALIVIIFGNFVTRIPLAALAALLLVTAASIVNVKQFFLCLKATSADALVLWTTLLACIFFSLDMAFYIGVAISIIFYLKKAALPQLVEYDIDEAGDLVNLDPSQLQQHKTIRVIKVEGELFFGAADLFQSTLKTIAEDDTSTQVIILQLKNARDIDATTCLALQQLHEYLVNSGRQLIACGLTPAIWEVLSDSGIVEQLGKENLFIFEEKHPHLHMQKALQKAKEVIASIEQLQQNQPTATIIKETVVSSDSLVIKEQDPI